jgi:signal transduction histidine kinase
VIRRLTGWWWMHHGGPERTVLLVGVAVRLGMVALLAVIVPLSWSRQHHPGWSVLLTFGLVAETLVVVGWWLLRQRLDAWSMVLELPAGAAAIVAGAYLTDTAAGWTGYTLWTGYAYPYTVVLSLSFGLALRSLPLTLIAALAWGGTELTAAVAVDGHGLNQSLFVLAPYLLVAAAGWTDARLFRANAAQLDVAREQATEQAAQLARERERTRHAQALHDRVLQTLEALSRDQLIDDEELQSRVVAEAAWLRRFVENGELDQSTDLPAELAAAVRVVSRGGVAVQLNDAALRTWAPEPLPDRCREALVHATFQVLAGLAQDAASVVVRAEPQRGGVLVTILTVGRGVVPNAADLDRARARLAEVGGVFTVEPVPYAELWVPGAAQ